MPQMPIVSYAASQLHWDFMNIYRYSSIDDDGLDKVILPDTPIYKDIRCRASLTAKYDQFAKSTIVDKEVSQECYVFTNPDIDIKEGDFVELYRNSEIFFYGQAAKIIRRYSHIVFNLTESNRA